MDAVPVNVVALPEEPKRTRRRMLRAIAARHGLEPTPPPRGRTRIDGRELDGDGQRFAQLSRSRD